MEVSLVKGKDLHFLFKTLIDVIVLLVNLLSYRFDFYRRSKAIEYFDVKYKYSLEARLIKLLLYYRINNLKELPNRILKPKYKQRNIFKSVVRNNQIYIWYSDEMFFRILNSNNMESLVSMPLNPFFENNASVEWVLKELGCQYDLKEILNKQISDNKFINYNYELPESFNTECSLFKGNELNYLRFCNEFPRNLKKPTYSAVLLYEHILFIISNKKEGFQVLNVDLDIYKQDLMGLYPNTINRKTEKARAKKFEKSIKRILKNKVEFDRHEKEAICGAYIIAKIKDNHGVLDFLGKRIY